ncbi:MAG TPA: hypothetical protein PLW80_08110, partial [Spirochaetales bacterium]|nr:hypothetical protein [Spirochaetales bacterium]
MNNGFVRWFLVKHAGAEPMERQQIGALLYTLAAIGVGAIAVAVVMANPVIRLALIVLVLLSAALMLLVRAGFAVFSSVAATTLLSSMFAAIPFLQPYRHEYELYLLATLECFALIITGLIARRRWQSLVVLASALAALVSDFALRVIPNAGEGGARYSDIVITVLVVVIATAIERAI